MLPLQRIDWRMYLLLILLAIHDYKPMETLFNVPACCLQGFQESLVRRDTVQIKTRVAANLFDSERP